MLASCDRKHGIAELGGSRLEKAYVCLKNQPNQLAQLSRVSNRLGTIRPAVDARLGMEVKSQHSKNGPRVKQDRIKEHGKLGHACAVCFLLMESSYSSFNAYMLLV